MGDGTTKRRQAQLGKRAKNLHPAALTGNSVRGRLSVTNVLACYKTLRAPDMRCTSTEKQLAFAIIEKTSRKKGEGTMHCTISTHATQPVCVRTGSLRQRLSQHHCLYSFCFVTAILMAAGNRYI